MDAAAREDLDLIRLLLSYHPDVNIKDIDGETALSRTRDRLATPLTPQVIALLKQSGARELPGNRRRRDHTHIWRM